MRWPPPSLAWILRAARRMTTRRVSAACAIRSIVDSSPDLFYYRDETGRFASCNKMFEIIFSLSCFDNSSVSNPLVIAKAENTGSAIIIKDINMLNNFFIFCSCLLSFSLLNIAGSVFKQFIKISVFPGNS